jgi:hypothetical protein
MGVQISAVRTLMGMAEQSSVIHLSCDVSLTLGWDDQRTEGSGCSSTDRLRLVPFRWIEPLPLSCPKSLPSVVLLQTEVS